MDLRDMADLVSAADGVKEIEDALHMICNAPTAVGYEEGAMGKLSRIFDVIHRNSRFYDMAADGTYEIRDKNGLNVYDILDMDTPAIERAKLLLGSQ